MTSAEIDELEVLHGGIIAREPRELYAEHDVDHAGFDVGDQSLQLRKFGLVDG